MWSRSDLCRLLYRTAPLGNHIRSSYNGIFSIHTEIDEQSVFYTLEGKFKTEGILDVS